MRIWRRAGCWLGWLAGVGLAATWLPAQVPFSVPPGFQATLYADARLAPDVQALTLDARGRVVIAGPGYLRVLHDADRNGFADHFTPFAAAPGTPRALAVEGSDLLAVVDGWLCRFRDHDGNGIADAPPEKIIELGGGEEGARELRRGPDGWWYLLGGRHCRPKGIESLDSSPVRVPEGGVLLRLSPDFRAAEILAHGFVSPAGMDFNWLGDLFVADGDTWADYSLPRYAPAALLHAAYSGHHGWRAAGPSDGWVRPPYFSDVAGPFADLGRARPAGAVVYQHEQFPAHFHDGLFALDWLFGRVLFIPLAEAGASYTGAPEIFLEAAPGAGFAPTAAGVLPDGSLLVASGGKISGALYRVRYLGVDAVEREWLASWRDDLEHVLNAPEPLAPWSAAVWEPAALALGQAVFVRAAMDPLQPQLARVRAMEIVTRLFTGFTPAEAGRLARANEPQLRARLAWSLTCKPCPGFTGILLGLAYDPHPMVRRWALEGLLERYLDLEDLPLAPMLTANLGHADKRVRLLAARLAAQLPKSQWDALQKNVAGGTAGLRLGGGLAAVWRDPLPLYKSNVLELAVSAWHGSTDPNQRLDATRLMMLALGDFRVDPTNLVTHPYELTVALKPGAPELERVRKELRLGYSATATPLAVEAARLLAMLEEDDEKLARQVVARITAASPASLDLHYLTVLARLPAPRTPELTTRTANALAALDRKLVPLPPGARAVFHARLAEETRALFRRDPALAETWLGHRDYAGETAVALSPLLSPAQQVRAAALVLRPVTRNTNFVWTPQLVSLLAKLPAEQSRPLFRRQWAAPAWRETMTLHLAAQPDPADRARFIAGLDSPRLEVVTNCLAALTALPPDESPQNLGALVRLLARTAPDARWEAARGQALALLNRQSGQSFIIQETNTTPARRIEIYRPIEVWFAATYPAWAKAAQPAAPPSAVKLPDNVPWARGSAARGAAWFGARDCAVCHAGPAALGPDLAATVDRLAPTVLIREIAEPDLHIPPDYQATEWRLRGGAVVRGIPVYQTYEVVLAQTARGLVRLPVSQITAAYPSASSLMPPNQLKSITPVGIADLYAFLKTLMPGQ